MLDKKFDNVNEEFYKEGDLVQSNVQLMKLSAGISKTLFENYKAESENGLKKLEDLKKEMTSINVERDSLSKKAKVADSITLIAYNVKFLYQITNTDRTIKRDTGNVVANLQYRLLDEQGFLAK